MNVVDSNPDGNPSSDDDQSPSRFAGKSTSSRKRSNPKSKKQLALVIPSIYSNERFTG